MSLEEKDAYRLQVLQAIADEQRDDGPPKETIHCWQDIARYHRMYSCYLALQADGKEITVKNMVHKSRGRLEPTDTKDFLSVANAGLLWC